MPAQSRVRQANLSSYADSRNDPGRFIGSAALVQRAIESCHEGEGHVITEQLLYVCEYCAARAALQISYRAPTCLGESDLLSKSKSEAVSEPFSRYPSCGDAGAVSRDR